MLKTKIIVVILVLSLLLLTSLFILTNLTAPHLVGYYLTSNGIVKYYTSKAPFAFTPEFIIEPYLNWSNKPAYISIFLNLPNKVVPLEQKFALSLVIPFKKLKPYMSAWSPWAKETNTSLLVIVTYLNGDKGYTSAEEVDYSPLWIMNNTEIKVVAEVNVVGKSLNINWGLLNKQAEKLFQNDQQTSSNSNTRALAKAQSSSHPYKINVMIQNETLKSYTISTNTKYNFNFTDFIIKNISIPAMFVAISNNVIKNDKFSQLWNQFVCVSYASWEAIVNTSNYGGPYIGSSYNATVDWHNISVSFPFFLTKLNNPILYFYYNATIAVVQYTVYEKEVEEASSSSSYPLYIICTPVTNVTVVQVLWANPNKVSFAFESSGGETCIYTNISGKTYINKTYIGNGSVGFYFEYLNKMNAISSPPFISISPYAYINWTNFTANYRGELVDIGGGNGWALPSGTAISHIPNYNPFNPHSIATLILGIAIGVLTSIALPASYVQQVVSIISSVSSKVALFILYPPWSSEVFTVLWMWTGQIGFSTLGHVYLSVLKYSVYLPTLTYGFMLNYSSFDLGFQYPVG